MLIVALALSALNAIMGCARSLHQMSVDGQFPALLQRINQHGVPARAMFFNVVASLVVVLLGGAVEIYSFSNVGYTFSFLPVLIGYYLLRRDRPNARRPFKLPEAFKYVALALAVLYAVIWLYGGIMYSTIFDTEITTSSAGPCCSPTCRSTSTGRGSRNRGSSARGRRSSRDPPGLVMPGPPAPGPTAGSGERRGASGRPFSKAATEEGQGRRAAESERAPVLLASEGRPLSRRGDLVRGASRGAIRARACMSFQRRGSGARASACRCPVSSRPRAEWSEQRENVAAAVRTLKERGLGAEGHVVGTRRPTKEILAAARRLGVAAIVTSSDPPRNCLVADLMWSQEPQRVRRRARIPVHLVEGQGQR